MAQAARSGPGARLHLNAEDTSQAPIAAPRGASRQTPTKRYGAAASSSASRSTSQPKQRASSQSKSRPAASSTDRASPSQPPAAPLKPAPTPFEIAMQQMKATCEGKSAPELESMLQQKLLRHSFVDAAYLIAASPALSAKFQMADLIRLMLEMKQFDPAGRLIREMQLHQDQALVTLFVKELVCASMFHAAVRYAQEFVVQFGAKDADPSRPAWTPHALLQAMLRARQFKTALKYAKQFDLLATYAPAQLVRSMLEAGCFEDAVSSVMDFRLFAEFPLEELSVQMLRQRQWTCAFKCISKLPTKELIEQGCEALVREASRAGDFMVALKYLRECKLDQPGHKPELLKYFVDCLINNAEFYKAIKYAIKFGLTTQPNAGDEDTSISSGDPKYETCALIRQAIECGQYHVALTYIKRFKLQQQMKFEMEFIEQGKARMLLEFRGFLQLRETQFLRPENQQRVAQILGDKLVEEWSELPTEVVSVLSTDEELIPRRAKRPAKEQGDADDVENADVAAVQESEASTMEGARPSLSETESVSSRLSGSSDHKQSRFSFARTGPSAVPTVQPPSHPPASSNAPDLSGVEQQTNEGSFDLARFAASLQEVPTQAQTTKASLPTETAGTPFSPLPPNVAQFFNAAPPLPPLPPTDVAQHGNYFSEAPPSFASVPGFPQAPPPPPPPAMQMLFPMHQGNFPTNGSLSHGPNLGPPPSPSMDVSSLAMQFHQRPMPMQTNPNMFGMPHPPPFPTAQCPPLPPGPPPSLVPVMPLTQAPMQSTFKPSMTYTSVTTTRQKKPTQ